jgi:UDP-GlcNAc:undecaprenyl-phosphate GlcNAc-1-phosphate transferase
MAFLIALSIALMITPLIKERASKLKLEPRGEGREATNIPRLGGIAILIALILTTIIYLAIFGRYTPSGIKHLELEGIATGAFIIFFIGLLDDLKPLAAPIKLGGQILAAVVAWLMNVRIEFLANPIHYIDHARLSALKLDDLTSLIITVIFLVAMTNAINLIDGIDGLAVGVTVICCIASWAINLSPILNQPAGAILSATLAGACFGFLRYNFNPARIFLGDNGAYLLGFMLACISCIGLTKKVTVVTLSPILALIFLVPLIDMLYAIFRRATASKPIMKPDLEHFHHKLLNKGLSHKQINYLFYGITFTAGLIGTYSLGIATSIEYLLISTCLLAMWLFFSLVINARRQR